MRTEPTTFSSDGLTLRASYFFPDDDPAETPRPLVIPCSGFTGLMTIHPSRFARSLTAAGHRCFAFDYRGFGESEGPRGRVLLEEQVRDIRNAVAFAQSDDRVDGSKIILLGWGMAGGLILDASRAAPGVIGLIAANGFYDGRRVQRAHRGDDGLRAFEREVQDKAAQRTRTGASPTAEAFHLYPLDSESRSYVDATLRTFEKYDADEYGYELAESLLAWRPEAYAPEMTLPLLIAHGDRNKLHPTSEAQSLHERYGGEKELFWIEDAGHTEFMHDDNPRFRALASRVVEFVNRLLA